MAAIMGIATMKSTLLQKQHEETEAEMRLKEEKKWQAEIYAMDKKRQLDEVKAQEEHEWYEYERFLEINTRITCSNKVNAISHEDHEL